MNSSKAPLKWVPELSTFVEDPLKMYKVLIKAVALLQPSGGELGKKRKLKHVFTGDRSFDHGPSHKLNITIHSSYPPYLSARSKILL